MIDIALVAKVDLDDEVFAEKLAAAHAELREVSARAAVLESEVDRVLERLLEG